jgi:type VI secretion system protein ImpA
LASHDSDRWLAEVTAEEPAGPNLEFDASFGALERSAAGKPEQQYGSTLIAAEQPNWQEVANQAAELLDHTRDLRVLVLLAVSRLHLDGLSGFVDALALTRELLETRWEQLHPQLDPEDDNDPTLRANALLRLADPGRVLRPIRDLPLVVSTLGVRVSWRDIAVATGAMEADADSKHPNEMVIRGAFGDSDPARITLLRDMAKRGERESAAITGVFDERSGCGTGPDLTELTKMLREVHRGIDRYALAEGSPAPADDQAGDAAIAPGQSAPPPRGTVSTTVTAAMLTTVNSRAEAMRLLELVSQYYARNEPSSPLPLLLDRARRLADMNFLDIIRDIAPDGLGQAQIVTGPSDV